MKSPNMLISIIMLFVLLSACVSSTGSSSELSEHPEGNSGEVIQITDMTGRDIALNGPIEKVVALTSSDCEILYALDAGDALIGRGEYCNFPAEVEQVPMVQSGNNTNIEQIIALQPQVVIMNSMAQTEEQITSLENAGVKVIINDAVNIEGVYESIKLIGQIVGENEKAAALVSHMKSSFDEIKSASSGDGGQSIYFEVSPLEYGLWTAGNGTFMDEIAQMLGLTNIFSDVSNWSEVSEEQVISRNPDYIVTIFMNFGEGPSPVEEIKGRAGWQNMSAVVNDQVFLANEDELSRPGPRLVDGANALFDFVYPSR